MPAAAGRVMHRSCGRCGFTLPIEQFRNGIGGRAAVCCDCWSANPAIWRVAAAAADGLVRLRAIDALLGLGYTGAARLIARGATDWPSMRDLRRDRLVPRRPLWWIAFDVDTTALLRMLLRAPHPARTPRTIRLEAVA